MATRDTAPWLHSESWPPNPTHVAAARRFVEVHLREHGLWRQHDAVRVVVSELATNAVLYTRAPFRVSLSRDDHTLTLTVRDGSLAPPEPHPLHGDFDVGGRGLQIVERLSSAWGVTPERDGKSVWARFDLPRGGPAG